MDQLVFYVDWHIYSTTYELMCSNVTPFKVYINVPKLTSG